MNKRRPTTHKSKRKIRHSKEAMFLAKKYSKLLVKDCIEYAPNLEDAFDLSLEIAGIVKEVLRRATINRRD